jgi:hypothetical protein
MLGSVVQVDTAEELSVALRDAVPCQRIVVAPGEYKKNTDTDVEEELQFVLDGPGQSNCPIIVDAKGAVLVGEGYNTPVLSLLDADYVILNDFSSVGGTNGISSELSDRAFVSVDQIRDTGFEAIVPFNFTQNMTIDLQSGSIHETGKVDPARGEAIYIGSGMPDAAGNIDQSSGNVIMGNMPAAQDPASPAEAPRNIYGTAAEAVEIGPGVRDTRIEWLQIDAAAMTGANACITDAGENTSISGVTCAAVPVESDIVRVRTDPAVVGSGEGVFVSDIALNGTLSPGRFYVAIEAAIQKRTVHCVPGMAPEVPYSNIPCVPDAEQSAG